MSIQKIDEAIVLAGGMGTRLKGVIDDIPKPMAPIQDVPFLAIVLDQLHGASIRRAILSVGYRFEVIQAYFGDTYRGIELAYAIETEPLGTGGGIALATEHAQSDHLFILNGDTLFDLDLQRLAKFHLNGKYDLSIALKPMKNFDRYGTVNIDETGRIEGFKEKAYRETGLINGGIYAMRRSIFDDLGLPAKFSFEKEVLEVDNPKVSKAGLAFEDYFIDIGIPEDYEKAQHELR